MSRLMTARRAIRITGLAAFASLAMAGTAFAGTLGANGTAGFNSADYTADPGTAETLVITQSSATS